MEGICGMSQRGEKGGTDIKFVIVVLVAVRMIAGTGGVVVGPCSSGWHHHIDRRPCGRAVVPKQYHPKQVPIN